MDHPIKNTLQSKLRVLFSFFGTTSAQVADTMRSFAVEGTSEQTRKAMIISFLYAQDEFQSVIDEIDVSDHTFTSGVKALEISIKNETSLFIGGVADFAYGTYAELPLVHVLNEEPRVVVGAA